MNKINPLEKPEISVLISALNDKSLLQKEYREVCRSSNQSIYHVNDDAINEYFVENAKWKSANEIIEMNRNYITNVDPNSIDKKNLARLIDTIHADGKFHFNMSVFFGELGRTPYSFDTVSAMSVSNFNPASSAKGVFDQTTNAFNCNSVGCIAGFASAIAANWNNESVANISDRYNPVEAWENIACNFLNMNVAVGQSIFYGESGSLWSYLKVNDEKYEYLDYNEETQSALEYDDAREDEYEEIGINLLSIDYKLATEVLSMILEGEIEFSVKPFRINFTDKYIANNPNVRRY